MKEKIYKRSVFWGVLIVCLIGLGLAVQASVGAISLNSPASFPVDI